MNEQKKINKVEIFDGGEKLCGCDGLYYFFVG